MTKSRIRMLTIDVFGTVVDWYSTIVSEGGRLGRGGDMGDVDWGEFASAWRGRYGPSMQPIRDGDRAWVSLDVLHRENLLATLAEFGIDSLSDAHIEDFNRVWHRLRPWPDSVDAISRLKSRFIVATLSNGHIELIVNMAKHAGLSWDVVLGAEPTQQYKPHRDVYVKSAQLMGLAPEACMMVAAHANDLAVAKSLGFRTAYVHRPEEFGPGCSVAMPDTSGFDFAAADLLDLAEQLDC